MLQESSVRVRSTSRDKRSKSGQRKHSKPREAYSGNSGCHLFGGQARTATHVSRSEKRNTNPNDVLQDPRQHLLSLERQISDKKRVFEYDKTLYLSADYIKLKLGLCSK